MTPELTFRSLVPAERRSVGAGRSRVLSTSRARPAPSIQIATTAASAMPTIVSRVLMPTMKAASTPTPTSLPVA